MLTHIAEQLRTSANALLLPLELIEDRAPEAAAVLREQIEYLEGLAEGLEEYARPMLPDELRETRERCGMTQREFAALIGVQHGHLSEMENGVRQIPVERAARVRRIALERAPA